jgi:serine phosphatase RsbU (regulator of sigma subunit)
MSRESDSLWFVTLQLPESERFEFKVTGGSWWMDALDSNEAIPGNFSLRVERDTVVHILVHDWLNRMVDGRPVYDAKRFRPRRPYVTLDGLWRYHPGDDTTWARPGYDDRSWVVTDPFIQWRDPAQPDWNGIGWFRFHMNVDSSLWNATLAIRIQHLGASQIYYNGRLLYEFGNVGAGDAQYQPTAMTWWQPIRIDPRSDQLIAVRYANRDWKSLLGMGYAPGFLITLKDLSTAFQTATGVRENAARQMVFTLVPLILFFVHLSLYGFFRKQRENLFYALCMLGFAGLTYFNYERSVIVEVDRIILFTKLNSLSAVAAILFGLLTSYDLNYEKWPKRRWVFFGISLILAVVVVVESPARLILTLIYSFFGLSALEILYSSFNKKSKSSRGGWTLLAGFLLLCLFMVLQILQDYNVIPKSMEILGTSQFYALGMLSLAIAMSTFLSYNFGRVNRDLETQLQNVRHLSGKAIEQERLAHRLALERQLIELESDRKSKELESARELQLSLLPREVPRVRGLDVAGFMTTATEVGGDYYDFFVSGEETLTAVLGDATGHGLKAGNLVTATKGLLAVLSDLPDVDQILVSANRAIKQMNLHLLTMGLAIVRIRGGKVQYSSGGMPPLIVYRSRTRRCEQHVLKAMPLGAVADGLYARTTLEVSPGDVVVMASDGLLEIFDAHREIYGIDNAMRSLERHAEGTAEEITRRLLADGRAWGGENPLEDDLTIVVLKIG